ncbi:DUF1254 domain-containing protein [Ruegeria pomeroyi]|uniref:DUF1254 domain-containing protein n=1 Tax=Ruegeria pomeroyi TaxID=89184 RepID=A0A9Q3WQM0_9RHOB|nr:DUF1254 domain-containing protein [Ruegeria pomeroyi]MCE8540243.1 DUF1254 domain-containing protein [Ruegeria pomeroyi]
MKITRRALTAGAAGLTATALLAGRGQATESEISDKLLGRTDFWTALEAYTFAYPLVTMEYTRRVMTNVAEAKGTKAPMGQIGRLREYPDASFKDVTAPNADTLYTYAFFDVTKEPYVVSIPDLADRYALFPMLSGWTNVFDVPGKRTTGTGAQTFAVTGPGWSGTLPDGVKEYKSPTGIVWLLGRIYCTGTKEDYAEVHSIQDKISLVPLSAYGTNYAAPAAKVDPSIDMETAVRDQVNALTAVEYFTLFCNLMKTNPPAAADAPMVEKMATIGIVPGQDFDASKLDVTLQKRVPQIAFARIMLHFKESDGDLVDINGWNYTTKTGLYGTNYIQRALVTAIGLGANRPQDAVYPTSTKSASGVVHRDYSGSEKYVLTFPKDQLPPANGFWSITMYNSEYFFVDNPLNRYSISARQDLKVNADGSVDIYIQNETPGKDKETNWLPAPKDKFILMMRLYWPKEGNPSILDGSWVIPPAKKVS